MMSRAIFTLLVGIQFGSSLAADELKSLTPSELQESAVSAVDDSDAPRLLNIMKEMQSRQLLFFVDPNQEGCEREPDRVGILRSKPFAWAAARQAYFTFLRQEQMARGDCGCITGQTTFDEFAVQMFGATAATMSEEQFQELLKFKLEQENLTSARHRDYVAKTCAGE
ncbi:MULTISPECIES: hypothetical protein [Sulfitobacter]|jgi:hypothetical protein|uniref:Uncharacterized protein n=1 Tax=Sulfitobacter geojensis TaxID=1342299 RepID=A0AAE2W1J5_9RHOB|nr:hypothetical protein [Sulfitobacter geojensis]MBM1691447.1 hypothetical protein [Sulfitobacter geojensis]MBM1695513.1 hypothetical protein [Sulfitobacter geojensis]MBM1707701.1 hypothetical protein [Sulfitobacter geojensis]MBM1711763.1 hypothetical protein [Sulfitobacter geojensis]MBM1715826.1 hypothetical protein [Sulfitobacter geojensis]